MFYHKVYSFEFSICFYGWHFSNLPFTQRVFLTSLVLVFPSNKSLHPTIFWPYFYAGFENGNWVFAFQLSVTYVQNSFLIKYLLLSDNWLFSFRITSLSVYDIIYDKVLCRLWYIMILKGCIKNKIVFLGTRK